MLPKINETYNYFDDGKIRESRQEEVEIREVIKFNEIDDETLSFWKDEVEDCSFLYSHKTDYFVKGWLKDTKQNIVFVRTIYDGWFSLGFWGGRLDVDGTLTISLKQINNEK